MHGDRTKGTQIVQHYPMSAMGYTLKILEYEIRKRENIGREQWNPHLYTKVLDWFQY